MISISLNDWLKNANANGAFIDIFESLLKGAELPLDIEADTWNLVPWFSKVKNMKIWNLKFDHISHADIKSVSKIWILQAILTKRYTHGSSFKCAVVVLGLISNVLGARQFKSLKTDDLYEVERLLILKYKQPYAYSISLQQISRWLSLNFNLRLDFINSAMPSTRHGRYGMDEAKEKKLLSLDIIKDLLSVRKKEDISLRDKLCLSAFAVSLGTGFRIGELTMLPSNCLLKLDEKLFLLHFPEKGGEPIPRAIHPILAPMVEDSINFIKEETQGARETLKNLYKIGKLDWRKIIANKPALIYFVKKWAHDWTSKEEHKLINPNGVWIKTLKRFIDVHSIYIESGCNKAAAARKIGISRCKLDVCLATQESARKGKLDTFILEGQSRGKNKNRWDGDPRFVTIAALAKHCGFWISTKSREVLREIITEAQLLQIQGKIYANPELNITFEQQFILQREPILRNVEGKALLYRDEALFLIPRNALSDKAITKELEFTYVTEGYISRWLNGEKRLNHQDSVFNRFGIIDPRTDRIAKFTSHDIRHWLNTIYQNGGLSEEQIALIFNRKYKSQNATYDQTSNQVRTERLRDGIREKIVIGHIAESYHHLANYSREDAEEYLTSVTRMINPMPHGVCTLSWATNPCPHHLSCFSCADEEPCEHLIVDPKNNEVKIELVRMSREAKLIISANEVQGITDSPTIDHYKRISMNVDKTLERFPEINFRTE
jgi:hypothetical protein